MDRPTTNRRSDRRPNRNPRGAPRPKQIRLSDEYLAVAQSLAATRAHYEDARGDFRRRAQLQTELIALRAEAARLRETLEAS